MTNKEAERKIYEHMKEIRRLHREVCKSDDYLSLCISHEGVISFSNSYWELPEEEQINFFEGGRASMTERELERILMEEEDEEKVKQAIDEYLKGEKGDAE